MSKHTSGPWLYRGKSDSVHEVCDTHPFGRQIFRFVEDEAPSDEDISLILAAPDLLEALEEIAEYPELDAEELKRIARAAIRKAKGESA